MEITLKGKFTFEQLQEATSLIENYTTTDGINDYRANNSKSMTIGIGGDEGNYSMTITGNIEMIDSILVERIDNNV